MGNISSIGDNIDQVPDSENVNIQKRDIAIISICIGQVEGQTWTTDLGEICPFEGSDITGTTIDVTYVGHTQMSNNIATFESNNNQVNFSWIPRFKWVMTPFLAIDDNKLTYSDSGIYHEINWTVAGEDYHIKLNKLPEKYQSGYYPYFNFFTANVSTSNKIAGVDVFGKLFGQRGMIEHYVVDFPAVGFGIYNATFPTYDGSVNDTTNTTFVRIHYYHNSSSYWNWTEMNRWFEFEAGKPYIKVRMSLNNSEIPRNNVSTLWSVFPGINYNSVGYDRKMRVTIPWGNETAHSTVVYNADNNRNSSLGPDGMHINPYGKPWAIRIGGENTLWENISIGWFAPTKYAGTRNQNFDSERVCYDMFPGEVTKTHGADFEDLPNDEGVNVSTVLPIS